MRLNRFIEAADRDVLQDAGRVTLEIAHAERYAQIVKFVNRLSIEELRIELINALIEEEDRYD